MTKFLSATLSACLVICSFATRADEGMWTYHAFPSAAVKDKYGVNLDQRWLDRVRSATVRLAGCTASFVSPAGLVLTNHHCIEGCLADLSTENKSLVQDGFLAATRAGELKCATQVADVLIGMEDVSAKVAAAVAGKDDTAANAARKQAQTDLEQACESTSKTDRKSGPLRCQTVELYNGGQYWLYKYKRYTDLRLVFAPESGIAAFGGDPDNFQFPRWCLDMGMLRAYENGKPAATPNYLKIDFAGPKAGEFVAVSGHPGSTDRLLTLAQLQTQRNVDLPQWLMRASELRGRYIQYSQSSTAAALTTEDLLNGLENGIKVRRKQLDALLDDDLIRRKAGEELALKATVAADAKLSAQIGNPWRDIANAQASELAISLPYTFIENGAGFPGRLINYARTLVRGTQERDKPNNQRFREYTDGALPRITQTLGAAVPQYPQIETLRLTFGLQRMREWLGPDHPMVRKLLSSESPEALASRVVSQTKLGDPAVRLALWNGGAAAVAASNDPMIELARAIEPTARALREQYEREVEAPVNLASEKIASARFAALGTSVYPDATFTLRLNYGSVQGWLENGAAVEPFTRLERAFERATGADPFKIPDSWQRVKDKLDMSTPFNVSTNNDIVGGNSGSPLINAKGNIVGLLFDGNIHSISGAYWFDNDKNRAIAVHPAIMREALTKVYGASAIARELGIR
jgi:hypothetical protein